MIRFITEIVFALTAIILVRFIPSLKSELLGTFTGLCFAAAIEIVVFIANEKNFIHLYWNIFTRPKRKIRLTLAYLFKIEEQGRYLLIRSNRIPNAYQPVGGVYKYFSTAKRFLDRIHAHPDHLVPQDDDSENDLRIDLYQRWRLRKFLKWFFAKEERETDPWREFQEELVSSGILPAEHFSYVHHELLGQHIEPIHFDVRLRVDTFKYADIFSLQDLTSAQRAAIRSLLNTGSSDYLWATPQEIESEVTATGMRILPHSKKILHPKSYSLC